jgi:glycosyltransferase involved in cell wall biosynthesis
MTHAKILTDMTDKKNYNVVIVGDLSKEYEEFFISNDVKVYNIKLDNNLLNSGSKISKLVRVLKKEKPDIVHIHGYIASIAGRTACSIAGISNIIVTLHNYMPRGIVLSKVYILLEKIYGKKTKRYIAVSNGLKKYFMNELHIPEEKITTIYNGIESEEEVFEYSNCSDEKTKVITIARLTETKGVRYFILAAIDILKHRDDVEFLIGGDGPLRAEFETMVSNANCQDKIKFLGYRNDIHKFLNESYLFVLPSFAEGFSIACLEAMRAKKPIVATKIDGTVEQIKDGVNGLIVEAGNKEELKNAIERYLDGKSFGYTCGENGYKMYKEFFTSECMYEKTHKVYKDALK